MSEGQQFEIPPKSREPQSVEAVLEKGEIESAETLKGYFPIKVIKIKDDGRALFKPSMDEFQESNKKVFARIDLETLVAEIDKILGFNLVPPLVSREVKGQKGVFQQLMDARPIEMPDEYEVSDLVGWSDMVDDAELLKGAVFDYLINAKDRHGGNFLLDLKSKKIWLVDHDYLMFFQARGYGSDLIRAALNKNIVRIDGQIKVGLENLQSSIDELVSRFKSETTVAILQGVKERTVKLLQKGEISTINT